jgi:hypothetical protein
MLGHDSLKNYYRTNFALMHMHKYSLSELENMIPWEKGIYLDLLKEHIKQQEETRRDRAATQKRMKR